MSFSLPIRLGWPATFRSLRHRNFRLFWFGQLISLTGSWMQSVAQGWLVLEIVWRRHGLTDGALPHGMAAASLQHQDINSSLELSIIAMLGSLPMMLFCLFAGGIADRHDRRRILVTTQILLMILALALGVLARSPHVQFWHVALLATLTGLVNAFDMPTRQSFVKDMVGGEDLLNAIALNSSVFNGARIIGPWIAAWLIEHRAIGLSGTFILNGASYLPVICGMILIRYTFQPSPAGNFRMTSHLREGFAYVARHKTLRLLMLMMAFYSVFGFSYFVLMPQFARGVFHKEVGGYSSLLMASGIGALTGALLIASTARRARKGRVLLAGSLTFSLALVAFGLSRNYRLSLCILPFVGLGLVSSNAAINSLIQEISPDHLRGRIVSIWTFLFAGLGSVGSLYIGTMGKLLSPSWAVFSGGAMCLLLVATLSAVTPWIWRQR